MRHKQTVPTKLNFSMKGDEKVRVLGKIADLPKGEVEVCSAILFGDK